MNDHREFSLTNTSLSEYFMTQLQSACESLQPALQEDTLCYVGGVLSRFARSEDFFHFDEGKYDIRPLALLYKDALESTGAHERELYLRQLGDMSLFMGAIFADKYAKNGIKRDYFAGMGGAAYDYLASNALYYQHVFAQMAEYIAKLINIVAEICTQKSPFDSSDVLRLYKRWQQTGDELAAIQLRRLGINLEAGKLIH